MPDALIIDDDPNVLRALSTLVAQEGFSTSTATHLADARRQIGDHVPDLVLTDLMLPDGQGTEIVAELQSSQDVEVILITANATLKTAVEALRLGAYDYLTKPVDVQRLRALLAGFSRTRALREEVTSLRGELRKFGRFGSMVGTSSAMQAVYDLIERVAPTTASVLVVGESGTGKELAAQTIHALSKRKSEPFLPINCGAISANLIESELFGHEKGSFTGADRRRSGFFEQANGGTFFLDEITEMPIELQVKLLRVLETGVIRRVGGTDAVPVDVRIVAATNRDPQQAVADGKLREDLYYRLKVFPITLPPLRQRGTDIVDLANHFLSEINQAEQTEKVLTPESVHRLQRYPWPGNVRELKNIVQRAHILADTEITADCLPVEVDGGGDDVALHSGPYLQIRVGSAIAAAEKRLILATLDQLDNDKRQTAKVLGISLKTLYNRLNQYSAETSEREAETVGKPTPPG